MKATIKDGAVTLKLYHLLEQLTDNELKAFADSVAIQDHVITYVVQQILDGWTDHDSRAALTCVAETEPRNGLGWALREIAKRSGDVASKEIKRLEEGMKHKDEELNHLRKYIDEQRWRERSILR